jgi:hypothetical protein
MEKPQLQTFVSILFTGLSWISLQNMQVLAAIVASVVAALSGTLAGVNWWYSIQEKRKNLKSK